MKSNGTRKHMTYALGIGTLPSEPLYLRTVPMKSKNRKGLVDFLLRDVSKIFDRKSNSIRTKIN